MQISFDLSLARGLDYYTGIIYEVVTEASAPPGFNSADAFASTTTQPPTANTEPPPPQKKKGKKEEKDDDEEEVEDDEDDDLAA